METRNDVIVRLYISGESCCDLAKKYNVSRQRILQITNRAKAHREDVLTLRKETLLGMEEQFIKLRMDGMTHKEIANLFRTTVPYIHELYDNIPRYGGKSKCCECGEVKEADEFYKNSRYRCIKCQKENLYKRRKWSLSILDSADYKCEMCGDVAVLAHHKKSYTKYIDLRFDMSNGMALCKKCHKQIHAKRDTL